MVLPEFYLDFWRAYDILRPLALFVVSIVIYGVFVFHFYRFLARKDIFQLDLSKYNESGHPALRKTVSVIFYFIKSLVMFPLFVAFWFVTLAGLMLVMGRGQSIDGIMLGAMGVVATIRVCAYYNTALATDIAKILPFALLGIMLIDSTLVQIPESAETIQVASARIETVAYYLIAVVALEFLLRIVSGIFGYFSVRSPRRHRVRSLPTRKSAASTAHGRGLPRRPSQAGLRTGQQPSPVAWASTRRTWEPSKTWPGDPLQASSTLDRTPPASPTARMPPGTREEGSSGTARFKIRLEAYLLSSKAAAPRGNPGRSLGMSSHCTLGAFAKMMPRPKLQSKGPSTAAA